MRKNTIVAIITLTISVTGFAQKSTRPAVSPIDKALNSIVGRTVYACIKPGFSNANTADGEHIAEGVYLDRYMHAGDQLIIRSAETDADDTRSMLNMNAWVKLRVEDQTNKATADLELDVPASSVTLTRLYHALVTDNDIKVSSHHVVPGDIHNGVSIHDVECAFGLPTETNDYGRGGVQMVYGGDSEMLVYINNYDRVEDMQFLHMR